jgi:hypothetical protein
MIAVAVFLALFDWARISQHEPAPLTAIQAVIAAVLAVAAVRLLARRPRMRGGPQGARGSG